MYRYILIISLIAAFLNQVFQVTAIWTHPSIRTNPLAELNLNLHQKPLTPFQSIFKRQTEGAEDIAPESYAAELPEENPMDNLFPGFRPLINPNETEAEKAERIHKTFEKLLTFVEIVGQVDNYVSTKWKNLVKTVSNFYDENDDDGAGDADYRVGARRKTGKPCGS